MKKLHSVLLALTLAVAGTTSAYAHDSFGFSINLGGPAYYAPPVRYYAPPPVVYYRPAPIYYGPQAYYSYQEPHYEYDHEHHDWHHRHGHHDDDD